ncbi:diphosphoinositol-polyphosphate diphosphatase [Sarracenia purpurea var. burkii]
MRLRLLLTYLQNGIEEPWQRIPSITAMFVAEASLILLDPLHNHYSTINDDAQIYIRNNILETLLGFYASPLSDNESKELILQVVKKSVKLRKMARYLVEHNCIISWLSSIVSFFCGKQYQGQTKFPLAPLITVLEVINDIISSRNTVEWLQKFALEQLSELSTHVYKLLVGGNLIKEKVSIVSLILQILTSTMKISQEREVYQPHFTLSIEGLVHIYEVGNNICSNRNCSPSAELCLKALLLSIPPVAILWMEHDSLLNFVRWAISTALDSNSAKAFQQREAYCHCTISLEAEPSKDSLISKLLRWLIASVILGRVSWRSIDFNSNFVPKTPDLETLQSLLECNVEGRGENRTSFGCEEILADSIFYLQQLLVMDCVLFRSVVSALCLLLFSDSSHLAGLDFLRGTETTLASLWSRIRCPVEANPTWRWSFDQPWKDISSESTDDAGKVDELHACQSLLVIISNIVGKKSPHSHILSLKDIEDCGVFDWERSFVESK